jgi:hypothetical protein
VSAANRLDDDAGLGVLVDEAGLLDRHRRQSQCKDGSYTSGAPRSWPC